MEPAELGRSVSLTTPEAPIDATRRKARRTVSPQRQARSQLPSLGPRGQHQVQGRDRPIAIDVRVQRRDPRRGLRSQFASSQDERDKAAASAESRFASINQMDWKTPSQALVDAIAARLYEMRN